VAKRTGTRRNPDVNKTMSEAINATRILWRDDNGDTGVCLPGQTLPPRSWPTAVITDTGSVLRLTGDPLPADEQINELVEQMQPNPARDLQVAIGHLPAGTVVAVDDSCSMQDLKAFAALAEHAPHLDVMFFSTVVYRKLSGGGGGTDFNAVRSYVESLPIHPPRVVMVTDGYAPRISPAQPDRWTWIILDDGPDQRTISGTPMKNVRPGILTPAVVAAAIIAVAHLPSGATTLEDAVTRVLASNEGIALVAALAGGNRWAYRRLVTHVGLLLDDQPANANIRREIDRQLPPTSR
jgi:hypothetical protein